MLFNALIAKNLNLREQQVANTLRLLSDGATIPFISRYRKEMTGELNEVEIQEIQIQFEKLTELEKRKDAILKSIEEQGKLTPELKKRIQECQSLTEVEDIYLPYKPKRRTRAEIAREKGLEPLAKILMRQEERDPENRALGFVKGDVNNVEEALQGAKDIIAEWVNENEQTRDRVRKCFQHEAQISSKLVKGKEKEAEKYQNYFDTEEPLRRCTSHRLLAMRRGEKEGFLRINIAPDEENVLERIKRQYLKGHTLSSQLVEEAIEDAYKRLLKPSIETEFANSSKEKADEEAIKVFAENLRQLLLASPLGEKRVLSIDPGYRTGCKVVCLDAQGNLLHNETIYPHPPQNEYAQSMSKIAKLVEAYKVEAIAIGNGTAGRETEQFVQSIKFDHPVQVFVVSESGASVYSASAIAREEFPDYDVTVRGAVSIGRRLMDPLAELVKIDPKSIGVGQYQHDVDQTKLKKSLDQTVINSVNQVGVNLNTASKHLLTYISGLGPQLAQNIVEYRAANGAFKSRDELKKVPRLGSKAYEQCAGFLRITDAENPLDNTAVHPESYGIVKKMANNLHCTISELLRNKEIRNQIDLNQYITEGVGLPTLKDIMTELEKPGRDCRQTIKVFEFDPTLKTIEDVKVGIEYPAIVTNITNFGVFADLGIKVNGLIHVSQLSDHFVSNPADVVSLHQQIMVKVLSVDLERKRIQLSYVK
ncbi:MAG: RNA-binding transcriptional accessory protein [Paludibacteraceae bacterium]|nr:RNA-binding transcriptional accessory protein [Paludibacteraceae bacterium]MBR5973309.1 RNA-binding transcriptional accessory protein [Paludibacteraceae bacterium]